MKSMFRHKASGVCPLLWHHSFLKLRVASAAVTLPPGGDIIAMMITMMMIIRMMMVMLERYL